MSPVLLVMTPSTSRPIPARARSSGSTATTTIRTGTGAVTVDGGSGEDTVILQAGNTGQVTGGTENDSI